MRHILGELIQSPLLNKKLIARRDVVSDMGQPVSRAVNKKQGLKDISGILNANCKRLQEALRVLEEYTKTINPQMAHKISQLRFEAYDIEQKIRFAIEIKNRFMQTQLYAVLPEGLSTKRMIKLSRAVIRGGADVIQLREKDISDRVFLQRARLLRQMTAGADILLVINDRVDMARLAEADGVHLGETDIPIPSGREVIGGLKIIGATTHKLSGAIKAQREGADYISVGVFFSSPTKPYLAPRAFDYLPKIAQQVDIPYVAIGGITIDNLNEVKKVHQRLFDYPLKVAVSTGIFNQPNVEAVTRRLKYLLKGGKH
jgi:thiamine-phosphate pyrophosphorylase